MNESSDNRPPSGYDVRRADLAAAKPEVLRLWSENFIGLSERRYSWLYENTPAGPARCWLARKRDGGGVVGATALFPRQTWIRGKERMTAAAGDFVVDPRHRAYGPGVALQQAAVSSCKPDGFAYLYGLPTSKSAAVQRRARYRVIGHAHRLTRLLRTGPYLDRWSPLRVVRSLSDTLDALLRLGAKETRYRVPPTFELEKVSTFDPRFDDLWGHASPPRPILTVRDSAYLNWRFAQSPERTYTTYALVRRESDEVHGYIVTRPLENAVQIVDFLVRDFHNTADVLLSLFLRVQRKLGHAAVSVTYFGGREFVKKLLEFGFLTRDREAIVLAYFPPDSPDADFFSDPENWYLFEADTDT